MLLILLVSAVAFYLLVVAYSGRVLQCVYGKCLFFFCVYLRKYHAVRFVVSIVCSEFVGSSSS